MPAEMPTLSRLRPFIADDKEGGPDTVLMIKGFSGRLEVEEFFKQMIECGLLIQPPPGSN